MDGLTSSRYATRGIAMARNIAATDVGVGQASVSTRIKLTIQAIKKCLFFGALPFFFVPVMYWLVNATPQEFDVVKLSLARHVVDGSKHRKWRVRDDAGERRIVSIETGTGLPIQHITADDLPVAMGAMWKPAADFQRTVRYSAIAAAVAFLCVWQLFVVRGRQQQANRRIRGAHDVVSAKELTERVNTFGASKYKLAGVQLPKDAPMRGILAIGAQGSGKSIAIHDFMQQVFARHRKCVIYDQSGEFFRAYYRPGVDIYFNPAFEGSLPWSIFMEMENRYDANTLAHAFLPPKSQAGSVGANSFFEDAARALFASILLRLTERGAVNTADIARAILEMADDEMDLLIKHSVASSAVAGDSKSQRQGVISSISIYLDGIAAVSPGTWSMKEFLDRPDDARLFIVGTDDTKAMFAPLYRLLLQIAFSAIASRQEIVHEDRYWFFLDETHTLGDIKIDEQLATLRKFGVCVFAGTQNDSQFVTSIGKDRAESTMNGFNTLLQLAMNDSEAMDRAAKRIGKAEVETISQNQAVAVVEQRDGAGLVINEQEKWAVMPATIGQLHTCSGYVKFSGDFPIAKVDYSAWLKPRFWFLPARIAAFAARQRTPPRDNRFRISRPTLPAGESAFDGVRRETEIARAEIERQKKEKLEREKQEREKQQANDQQKAGEQQTSQEAINVSMTNGSAEVATSNPNRELDLGL